MLIIAHYYVTHALYLAQIIGMTCAAFLPDQGYIHFGSRIYLNLNNKVIAQRKFQTYWAPKKHTQQFAN